MAETDPKTLSIDQQLDWLFETTYFADEGGLLEGQDGAEGGAGGLRAQMRAELKAKLSKSAESGVPLRVYLGVDPTRESLHIGHMIPVLNLKKFQALGHQVIFLIGDYTATVGDPSGQSKEREQLDHDKVLSLAKFYTDQAFRLLDRDRTEIRYNGEWLADLRFRDLVELGARFSLNRIIARQDFRKRSEAGQEVGLHETFYALMQGYDAFALNCDVQVGAYDQHMNLLAGRTLQKYFAQKFQGRDHPLYAAHPETGRRVKGPHVMFTGPLLMGTDGRKMSKSWGNTIDVLSPPEDMYGKVMRISDEMIAHYIDIAVDAPRAEKEEWKRKATTDPMGAKKWVAERVTALYHGEDQAAEASAHFKRTVQEKAFSEADVEEVDVVACLPSVFELDELRSDAEEAFSQVDDGLDMLREETSQHEGKILVAKDKAKPVLLIDVIVGLGLAPSKKEARRLMEQGGVKLDDVPVTDPFTVYVHKPGAILRVGKRKVVKLL